MSLSKLTHLIKKGRLAEADKVIENYRVMSSHEISAGGASKSKVYGQILHISKAASVSVAKKFGDKKIKRQMANYRLVFCRLLTINIFKIVQLSKIS